MFSFFKKKESDTQLKETVEAMQKSLKLSFENIKKDFSVIDKHHKTFHEKHEKHEQKHKEHETKFEELNKRLHVLESMINRVYVPVQEKTEIEINPERTSYSEIGEMTEVSQKICYILAALSQEGKKLVTLKSLSEEMYPGKEYARIRSTISQYTTELEELGYVQKKKKGRHVYIKTTEKNPFLKEKIILKKKVKTKE